MNETLITDESLKALSGLQKLNVVILRNTHVTDEGIYALRELPKLERLDLRGTRISKECTDALKAANRRLHISLPANAQHPTGIPRETPA